MPDKRNWDQAAAAVWPALTSAAHERSFLTYGQLAPLARTNPLSVGRALGPIQSYCMDAGLPPLTAIVIGKSTGVPGSGFVAWSRDALNEAFSAVYNYPWSVVENPFTGHWGRYRGAVCGKTAGQPR